MNESRANRSAGRPRDARTDQAILRAALELFLEIGIDETSFEKIAKRAGTTRTTIYRRYGSKTALLVDALGMSREQTEKPFGEWSTKRFDEIIALFKSPASIRAMLENTRLLARLIGSVADHPDIMATYQRAYAQPRRDASRRVLETGKTEGKLGADADVEIIVDMIHGAVMNRLLMHVPPPTEAELTAYIERLLKQALPIAE